MPATPTEVLTLRIGARVFLFDRNDHVLLIHAKDPDQPDHRWWELPGGGADPGEALADTARRELAEETGILLGHIGPHLWDRETRFHYRGREHHRRERVYLAASPTPRPPGCPSTPPTRRRASSRTAGGPNPNSLPAATNSFLPTFRRCSPTSWTTRSANRSSSTHSPASHHLSGKLDQPARMAGLPETGLPVPG
ncbi:MAG: NUDIX domain-containing protein [Actinomycetota bacterium]|nr:NUDIX domain-containing protein [Actinomycetota bacterium]